MIYSRTKWTRDEVILALDHFFFTDKKSFPVNDPQVVELSSILNELPIIPNTKKTEVFRNVNGMHYQLSKLKLHLEGEPLKVGKIFVEVYNEFKDDIQTLHEIAVAIKNCRNIVKTIPFGYKTEECGFREGALLSHLHRYFEADHLDKNNDDFSLSRCTVCKLDTKLAYKTNSDFVCEIHLTVPPTAYHDKLKFSSNDFVVVCPNCHNALHYSRPWLDKNNIHKILR